MEYLLVFSTLISVCLGFYLGRLVGKPRPLILPKFKQFEDDDTEPDVW